MVNILTENINYFNRICRMANEETGYETFICASDGEIVAASPEYWQDSFYIYTNLSKEVCEFVVAKTQFKDQNIQSRNNIRGYLNPLIIDDELLGAVVMVGEPRKVKPVVRIIMRMIVSEIKERIEEGERNKILCKLQALSTKTLDNPLDEDVFQEFVNDLKSISGARFVFLDLYDQEKGTLTFAAIAGDTDDIRKCNEIWGFQLLGSKMGHCKLLIDRLKNKNKVFFANFFDFAEGVVPEKVARQLYETFKFGEVYLFKISYQDRVIGNFTLKMPERKSLANPVLVELYASWVGQLLIRADVEKSLSISQEDHRETLTILDSFWENSPNPIAIFNHRGDIIRASNSYADLHGLTLSELEGTNILNLYDKSEAKTLLKEIKLVRTENKTKKYKTCKELSPGEKTHYIYWLFPVADDKTNISLVGMMIFDIIDRKKAEEKLNYLIYNDNLTNINNRAFYEKKIKDLRRKDDYPLTVMYLDLDCLKIVNDALGHSAGDQLLRSFAQILKKSLRKSDLLARVGGDEFVVLMPKTNNKEPQEIEKRVKENIEVYNQSGNIPLAYSLGIATAVQPESIKLALQKADEQMYRHKIAQKDKSQNRLLDFVMASMARKNKLMSGHNLRVQEMCLKLGKRINLSSKVLANLKLFAQFHDLGKIGIPDHILAKKEPLTKEEWEIVCYHLDKGYRIAMISPALSEIADLIYKRNEHWDGGGSPLGLKAEEIPLECRILAVVDTYDNLIENRHEGIRTKAEAIAELERDAGRKFDPEIVKEFVNMIR
ncbi:MAG: diguanylate cyclase domain-containing protein [Desulfitobacteriia bacterium]|jgi:diguanylate cyclase (GGDEF)-like protein/PAS domain S-box-containing protein